LARHAFAAIAVCARLPLVPVDRQPDEDDRNDPENDVFATAFFLGHARQYNTSEIAVQVPIEFLRSRRWFRLLYLRSLAVEFNNLAISLPALGSTTYRHFASPQPSGESRAGSDYRESNARIIADNRRLITP
jgi:hypothetical protein